MKKVVIVILVLVVIAALALPGWFGMVAEARLTEEMQEANTQQLVTFEVRDYERSWFSSSGLLDVRLSDAYVRSLADLGDGGDDMAEALGDGKLTFTFDIQHGPVVLNGGPYVGMSTSVMRLQPPTPEVEAWLNENNVPYLFEARTRTNLTGSTSFDGDVPPIEHTADDGTEVEFSGLLIEGQYDAAAGHLLSHGTIDLLRASGQGADIRVESITLDGDNTRLEEAVWIGSGTGGIARISATGAAAEAMGGELEVLGARITSSVEQQAADPQRLDLAAIYALERAAFSGEAVEDVEFAMRIKGLRIATIKAYNDWSQNTVLSDEAVDPAVMMEALAGLVHQALSDGPELAVDPLKLTYNDQPVSATLVIDVDESQLPPAEQLMVPDPSMWMRLVSASGQVQAARALVIDLVSDNMMDTARAQMAQQGTEVSEERLAELVGQQAEFTLATLVQQGMLNDDGTVYASEFAFTGGQLTVNGKPMPLPGLL